MSGAEYFGLGAVFGILCLLLLSAVLVRRNLLRERSTMARPLSLGIVKVPDGATVLQCMVAVSLHMQNEFMRGVPYNTPGVPNMQSLIELSQLTDEAARAEISRHPQLAHQLVEVVRRWPSEPMEGPSA